MQIYEVITEELFTVRRRVVAGNPRQAARKAVESDGRIIDRIANGFVEGSKVVVLVPDRLDDPVGEFDAYDVATEDEETS